jgi:two-component system cell cycle response regulator
MNQREVMPGDLVSLAKRMEYLQWLRIGLASLVLIAATATPTLIGSTPEALAPISLIYAALTGAVEGFRRFRGRRHLGVLSAMLLIDGVYLAWVMYLTGGMESPLRFLITVHVVAVSLLASYRTGLKIAMWHSLLLIAAFEAQRGGLIGSGLNERSPGMAAFNLTALWVVAIVTAMFSALNERELRRRRKDLEALTDMATALEHVAAPSDVGRVLLEHVTSAFGFRRGAVVGLRDRTVATLAATSDDPPPAATSDADAVLQEAWRARHPVLVRELDRTGDPWLRELLPDATNVVIFPMITEGRAVGAVILERGGAPRMERRLLTTADQFVAHAALALGNAWLLERVQHLAARDPLTGACNRRTFERELARAIAHAERSGEPMCLAMFDIDHFKKHNDRLGHQAGDDVLRRAAASLEAASRSFDTVARYGGEEFAVIMPGLDPAEALTTVERLRMALATNAGRVRVTASAGVAAYPLNARDAESLIRYADEALYASKEQGRDRTTRSRRRGAMRPVAHERTLTS